MRDRLMGWLDKTLAFGIGVVLFTKDKLTELADNPGATSQIKRTESSNSPIHHIRKYDYGEVYQGELKDGERDGHGV